MKRKKLKSNTEREYEDTATAASAATKGQSIASRAAAFASGLAGTFMGNAVYIGAAYLATQLPALLRGDTALPHDTGNREKHEPPPVPTRDHLYNNQSIFR